MSLNLELVLRYSRDLQSATTLDDLLSATKAAVVASTRYRTVWLAVFENVKNEKWVRVLAATGTAEQSIWEQTPLFPMGEDPMLHEISLGTHPVIVEDMQNDPRSNKEIVARAGNRTTINVPMRIGDATIAALGAGTFFDEGVITPTHEEIEHLTVFATQLGAAFDRVRLLEHKTLADQQATALEKQRRELEAQLQQAQRREAIGELAGGIAHDFNNILTAILGYAEMVRRRLPINDPLHDYINTILNSSQRAAQLTRGLLAFSRKQVMNPRTIDITQTVKDAIALLKPLLRENIELITHIPNSPVTVLADAGQIEQVLINIVNNACDAMPRGGSLEISVGETEIKHAFVARFGGTVGPSVTIAIRDSGQGMAPQTLERIFEPFFTTKAAGQGTGLGLATSQGIIAQHGGTIVAQSIEGAGSTFTLYLPITNASTERPPVPATLRPSGGNETILLVEDEPGVRRLLKLILQEAGYKVIEAVDGQDAIEQFTNSTTPIDLVLSDVIMPKRSGLDVYHAVRQANKNTQVLLMSGYAGEVIEQRRLHEEGLVVLAKPILPADLLRAVRSALPTASKRT